MNENDGQQPPPNRSDKEEQAPKPSPSESVSLLKGNRPARILLCDDEPTVRDCMRLLFEWSFRDYELAQCDTGHGTLREVARQTPDLLITDCCHVGLSFPETLPILYRMQVRFPIIVASAQIGGPEIRDRLLSFPTFDIALLSKPFTAAELRNAVLQFLGPNPRPTQDLISLARQDRTARIILLDDEPGARDTVRTMLPLWFRDYLLIECTTGDETWREITSRTPDLLITDYGHTGYSFEELLHRFYRSRSKFPILLSSLYVGACPELQHRLLAFPGYTIELLNKPFPLESLKSQVLKALATVNPAGN
jgi:DNA-binding NtrC family response regulator